MASYENLDQNRPLQPTAGGPHVPAGLNTPPTGDKIAPTGHHTGAPTGHLASTEHKYDASHDPTRNVPPTLDIGPPGHTPIPQNPEDSPGTGYMPDRHLPAQTGVTGGMGPGATTTTGGPGHVPGVRVGGPGHIVPTAHTGVDAPAAPFGTKTDSGAETVLTVTAPDLKTVYVHGPGTAGYTLTTTFEHHNELVKIHHGAPSDVTKPLAAADTAGMHHAGDTTTAHEPPYGTGEAMAPLAVVEVHQLRATKVSLRGGELFKLKEFLAGRGTNVHSFEDNGVAYEWRKGFHGLTRKLELFALDKPEHCIAWATKGHGLPASQDPNYTSMAPHLHDTGVTAPTVAAPGPHTTTTTTEAHAHAVPILGAAPLLGVLKGHHPPPVENLTGTTRTTDHTGTTGSTNLTGTTGATHHTGTTGGTNVAGATGATTGPQAYSQTSTKEAHAHAAPVLGATHPLPQNPANSTITLTRRATEIMDMVVLTFLLIDRETRDDPLH